MINKTSLILRLAVAATFMALAANCFLSYLWWTACYSAWSGIPKMADQWKAAGSRATLNGWSFFVLDAAAVVLLFSVILLRDWRGFGKTAVRVVLSLVITMAATGVFALALSWIKQGTQ